MDVTGGLEAIPAATGREAGYTLDMSPPHHSAKIETNNRAHSLQESIKNHNLTKQAWFFDWEKASVPEQSMPEPKHAGDEQPNHVQTVPDEIWTWNILPVRQHC